ncbi:hypothetical protein [Emticicia sp. BO119]|uniref:HD domain-containing protein n=1 Tax=Emticicia sp. BO119 TaxID=2757768 RepID=UPI001E57B1E5|nr:hypothetical protein [Emticicia sp. BO119]
MRMSIGFLKETFINLLKEYINSSDMVNSYWHEIEKAYTNKDRHYHTMNHLENMLSELTEVRSQINDWNTILFSLFYHDIIYNVLKSTNEEQSAELAQKRLQAIALPAKMIDSCYQQIIATQKHIFSQDSDTNFFTDADLSILGKDWFLYEQYSQRIRKEYSIYSDMVYKPARKKVLNQFLEMKRIFKTDYFFDKYESKARQNLLKEITLL